ncbi:MAG TPA: polyhydroxyalkanoic acid system family protein [Myxococcaceae bacterium]|nr:polyhydroxyalkanoic acid system family protein [Myxococcaceae bacterium]
MRPLPCLAVFLAVAAVLSSGIAQAEESQSPAVSHSMMFEQPHPFSRAEARERIQQLLDYWSSRWGIRRDWHGDSVSVQGWVMGVFIDAELVVEDHWVSASASDPGLFLRNAAFGYVSGKLRKYLHPSYQEG